MNMHRFFIGRAIGVLAVVALLVVGYVLLNVPLHRGNQAPRDYRNTTFFLEGEPVSLENGTFEKEIAPGAASKMIVRYLGNEARGDINGDGTADIVYLVTQEGGGSGTFYYLVGAIQHADHTFEGTHAAFIGDRIAPRTTRIRDDVVIVTYADRAPGESFSARPSEGKSLNLRYRAETNDFGSVARDSEEERTAPDSPR